MAIHYARIETSKRLQRAHQLLSDGRWHGTREVIQNADICAVNTVMTELRCNGYDIITRRIGQGLYEYQMIIEPQGSLF